MTELETFKNIAMLLDLFPGIGASSAYRLDGDSVQIRFRCDSFASLREIADCVIMCNERLEVMLPGAYFSDERGDDKRICFFVIIKGVCGTYSALSQAKKIGVFLARCLKGQGVLAADLADALQKQWGAVVS